MTLSGRRLGAAIAAALLFAGLLPVGPAISTETPSTAPTGGTVAATVRINPLRVEVSLPNRNVRTGQRVKVPAIIHNLGAYPIDNVVARLHVSDAIVIIDDAQRELETLQPGRQLRVNWQVCSNQPISQLLLVHADATLAAAPIRAESEAQLLVASMPGRGGPSCPQTSQLTP
jgi:hypothetical protein